MSATYSPWNKYIINSIDPRALGLPKEASDRVKLMELGKAFRAEYGWAIKRYSKRGALKEWLMGLPSYLNISPYYYDQLNLYTELTGKELKTEKQADKYLASFYDNLANRLSYLIDRANNGSRTFSNQPNRGWNNGKVKIL